MNNNYHGNHISFFKSDVLIAKGGNGFVYEAKIEGDEKEYVVKIFNYENNNIDKRYIRFKNEIKFVYDNNKNLVNCIPIVDYNLPNDCTKEEAWYIMPKCEVFNVVNRRKSLIQKLSEMLEIAKAIKSLHDLDEKSAHRDIKPENMLFYNGKLCLSDFGLIWQENFERITDSDERLGPYKIMPPEFEYGFSKRNVDYQKSDVYLFTKVVWMYIKNDNFGFRGEYRRNDLQIYLNKSNYVRDNVKTFEPIHLLLEKGTKDDFNERIGINECINLLQDQIDIQNNKIDCKKYILNEESKLLLNSTRESKRVYTNDFKQIISFIDNVISSNLGCAFYVREYGKEFEINPIKMIDEGDNKVTILLNDNCKIRFMITSYSYDFETEIYVVMSSPCKEFNSLANYNPLKFNPQMIYKLGDNQELVLKNRDL